MTSVLANSYFSPRLVPLYPVHPYFRAHQSPHPTIRAFPRWRYPLTLPATLPPGKASQDAPEVTRAHQDARKASPPPPPPLWPSCYPPIPRQPHQDAPQRHQLLPPPVVAIPPSLPWLAPSHPSLPLSHHSAPSDLPTSAYHQDNQTSTPQSSHPTSIPAPGRRHHNRHKILCRMPHSSIRPFAYDHTITSRTNDSAQSPPLVR